MTTTLGTRGRGRVRGMNAWQGTGTWHEQAYASEKIDSFPGRLVFFDAFLLFFVCFVWWYLEILYICKQ